MSILHIDHRQIDTYIEPFNDLMMDTFGFSFEAWYRLKHWSADYACYAIIDDGCMVASANVYRMEMLVSSVPKTCYQIGAVATRKTRRGEGLSKRIMNAILDQHPNQAFFLCANSTVLSFYPRFGFRSVQERQPWIENQLDVCSSEMVRLNITTDREKIDAYLLRRAAFSNILDCRNAAPIQWFHLLMSFPENIYELPDLGVMLVAKQEGDQLTLYNVCTTDPIRFDDIAPHLAFRGVQKICFGFNPDWLRVKPRYRDTEDDSKLFFRGELDLASDFILPMLIRT